jgi:hypothetical protein
LRGGRTGYRWCVGQRRKRKRKPSKKQHIKKLKTDYIERRKELQLSIHKRAVEERA